MPIALTLVGLGAIGQGVAALARSRGLPIHEAIDVDPSKLGRDLGDVLEQPACGIRIASRIQTRLPGQGASVAIHTTGSFLDNVAPQILDMVSQRLHVVSSAEELSYPWLKHAELARQIDQAAKSQGVAVVGVGVNPGFAMDALPAFLSTASQAIRHARVVRVVDTSRRRLNLQRKTGAGMTLEAFDAELAGGKMGHIGLAQSCALLAQALGWRVDEVVDEVRPIVADRTLRSEFLEVPAGRVAGLRQVASGMVGDRVVVELHLTMALGGVEDRDEVHLDGDPRVDLVIAGGLPGDMATAAVLLNSVPAIVRAEPGLRTILDLPLTHFGR